MTINPWNIPPLPKMGDRTDSITYEAVGRALSNWEFFESILGQIFSTLLRAQYRIPAMRAYGTIITFRGKIEMVEAAAEAYFMIFRAPRVQADFKSLMSRAVQFGARRNEIAHGRVSEFKTPTRKIDGWCLYPSFYSTNKYQLLGTRRKRVIGPIVYRAPIRKPKYAYTSAEINVFGQAFWDLAQEAGKLLPRISALALTPLQRRALKSPESLDRHQREMFETRLLAGSALKQ